MTATYGAESQKLQSCIDSRLQRSAPGLCVSAAKDGQTETETPCHQARVTGEW